jgi:hypothetical protein
MSRWSSKLQCESSSRCLGGARWPPRSSLCLHCGPAPGSVANLVRTDATLEGKLKALKRTIRNAPLQQESAEGRRCIFSNDPAREFVLADRAY